MSLSSFAGPARLALCLAVASSSGCLGAMTSQKDDLQQAIREFNDGIRWGMAEKSASHLPVDKRLKFAEKWVSLEEELEVLDYEIQRVEWGSSRSAADVRVDVTWSMKRRGIVEKTTVAQHWEQTSGTWLVTTQKRLRGTALSILE